MGEGASLQKTALVTGITGQDGGYLTELLLSRATGPWHGAADVALAGTRLGELMDPDPALADRVDLHNAELTDSTSLALLMDKTDPDEVYHLAGQSHIQISFDLPEYTGETTALGTLRILEIIRRRGKQFASTRRRPRRSSVSRRRRRRRSARRSVRSTRTRRRSCTRSRWSAPIGAPMGFTRRTGSCSTTRARIAARTT